MRKNRSILIFIDYFFPGYKSGGPPTSIKNIISALSEFFDFYVVTRDHDYLEKTTYNIPAGEWIDRHCYQVMYLPESKENLVFFRKIIQKVQPSLIYLNSFFSYKFSIIVVLIAYFFNIGAPLLIAPRGELRAEALNYKYKRKKFFLWFVSRLGFYRKIFFQATSPEEKESVYRHLGRATEILLLKNIPNEAGLGFSSPPEKRPGSLRAVYFSRIHPKKNLSYALNILKEMNYGEISFDIIGPISDSKYWKECQKLIKNLPENVNVNYLGSISPDQVSRMLKKYHAFLFPTKGENYGHAIVEAMCAACIPLISDQTPWSDLQKEKAGWALPLEKRGQYDQVTKSLVDMDATSYRALLANLEKYLERRLNREFICNLYKTELLRIIDQSDA